MVNKMVTEIESAKKWLEDNPDMSPADFLENGGARKVLIANVDLFIFEDGWLKDELELIDADGWLKDELEPIDADPWVAMVIIYAIRNNLLFKKLHFKDGSAKEYKESIAEFKAQIKRVEIITGDLSILMPSRPRDRLFMIIDMMRFAKYSVDQIWEVVLTIEPNFDLERNRLPKYTPILEEELTDFIKHEAEVTNIEYEFLEKILRETTNNKA